MASQSFPVPQGYGPALACFIGGGPLQTLTQPISHTHICFMLCGGEGKQIRALHIHSADCRNSTVQQLFAEGAL